MGDREILDALMRKASPEGTFQNAFQRYGVDRAMIVFWDLTEGPKDNSDRAKKLGKGDPTLGMAFIGGFEENSSVTLADGYTGGASARAKLEPDNWFLRLHEKEGKGVDNVWAVRLSVEHENQSGDRKHRSTAIIDQCHEQNWAWLMDLMWIKDLGAAVTHQELMLDAAGFLPMIGGDSGGEGQKSSVSLQFGKNLKNALSSASGLFGKGIEPEIKYKKGEGEFPARAALCNNWATNAGFVTDGVKAAQWWHLFTIIVGAAKPAGKGTTTSVPKVRGTRGRSGKIGTLYKDPITGELVIDKEYGTTGPGRQTNPYGGSIKTRPDGGYDVEGRDTGGAAAEGTTTSEPVSRAGAGGACGQVMKGDACLRGDVNFDIGGTRYHLAYDEAQETDGEILAGNHWLHKPSPRFPGGLLSADPASNQPTLGRALEKGIWVWVKKPREHAYPPDFGHPNGFNYTLGGVSPGAPYQVSRSGMTVHRMGAEGIHVGTSGVMNVPLDIPKGWGITFDVNFLTPAAGFTGNVHLECGYEVVAQGSSPTGSTTDTITRTINSTTDPGNSVVGHAYFHVPYEDIKGKEGGKLHFAIMRKGDDQQLDALDMIGKSTLFGLTLRNAT